MIAVSGICALASIPVILFPATISTMMGSPIEPELAASCIDYEESKQALAVMVCSVTLGTGILAFSFRNFTERATQSTILRAMLIATALTVLAASSSALGFYPLFSATTLLVSLAVGIYLHEKTVQQPDAATPVNTNE